jgi:hypothetical protein
VRGLLGANSGQRNDLRLADGTILPIPQDDNVLLGAFADAWRVAPDASLLDDTPMQFIRPVERDGQLLATASGQVLSGAPGISALSDAGGFGATFRGTLADLAREVIDGFNARDMIDVVGFDAASASASYTRSASGGVLHLSDGAQSGDVRLAGMSPDGFHIESDTHGGALVSFS